jgi:osmotically-inducible protein OsmY
VRHDDELSGGEVLLWTVLGLASGLVASVALSEWLGDVNPDRVKRVADKLRDSRATRLTGLTIEARAVNRGAVELRGWVPTRTIRTAAGRTALAVPGIESVINSILVRGEDDRPASDQPRAADQSA